MQVIHPAEGLISKAWNVGKPAPGNWRLLIYTFQTDCKGGTLLYNVITGELLLLSDAESKQLSSLPCSYEPWMDELIRKRFLVPEEAKDAETVAKLRTILRLIQRSTVLTGYTILPTMACNARCFYCYESGMPHHTMSEETVRDTVRFIAEHHGDQPVQISWFGGEPTLGIKQIDRICTGLRDADIKYSSTMISNGYLMTEPVVKHAKEDWKLTNIQITLDGTEEVYNRTKAYVGISGSPYRQVLDNIGHLLDAKIRVSVRLNLGLHNAEDLEALVRELAARFENKEYFSVYSHLLFEDCGFSPVRFETGERDRLLESRRHLEEVIRQLGLSSQKSPTLPVLKIYDCMADNDIAVIITPDGMLCKCEHRVNDLFSGNLKEGFTSREMLEESRRTITFPQCEKCFHYPACIRLAVCADAEPCSEDIIQEKRRSVCDAMKQYYDKKAGEPDETEV